MSETKQMPLSRMELRAKKIIRWIFAHPMQPKPEKAEPEKRGRRHAHLPFFTRFQHGKKARGVRSYNRLMKKRAVARKLEWMAKQPARATLQRRAV